jgi:RNA polymerase sigma-70 factor (ECF subfamily)
MQKTTKHKDDDFIIALLEENPREAIEYIIDKYGGALYTVIYKVVHSEEVARDLFQDACVKFWRHADKYDSSKGRLFTWLLNICRNTALDKARTAKFKAQQTSKPIDSTVYNNVSHSEEMTVKDIGLHRALTQIDSKYRDVIDLLYLQGYTQREAVEKLGIPLGTVKSRAQIAIRELRKILGESAFWWTIYLLFNSPN